MKLSNLYIVTFILSLFTFYGCMDELPVKENSGVEGIPTTVDLSYRSDKASVIETRASDITDADRVRNLIVLVFDKNGDRVGEPQAFTPDATSGSIRLNTTSGERYIFAIGNTESTNWGNLTAKINGVTKLEGDDDTALNHIVVKLQNEVISVNDDKILMSGWFEPKTVVLGKDKGYCNIEAQSNGVITSITEGRIVLKRIVASVRFKLQSANGVTFIPETWTVKNLPSGSSLIEQDNEKNGSYFNYGPSNTFDNPVTDPTNEFSFLMMENRKVSNAYINTYDAREKAENAPEDFTNAPANSAYLVLKGTYSGKANYDQNGNSTSGKDVTAIVTYYVHLGYLGGSFNDFSISRNNKYIYTLTVAGVDKIILEVTKNEDSASADGDVYMPENMLDPFDAHYGTTVLTFTKSLINSLKAGTSTKEEFRNNFQIRTYTPKNEFGTKKSNDGTLVQDYSWLSFKKNEKGTKTFATYDGAILSVDSLYTSLYNLTDNDYSKNGEVYYTCYLDEYYYSDLPKSKFVNADDRIVQFNYKRQSAVDNPGSNSSLTTALYVINQRSIQSIYNLDVENAGWGVEWIQEGGDLEYGKSTQRSKSTNMNDGRLNMIADLNFDFSSGSSYKWNNYVNSTNNSMKTTYNKAYAACLNRNRDLNKNGKIDEDEVRWYLPAINQYVGLWIGAPALNPQVRLYTKTSADDDFHYVSNTYVGSQNPRIIWAEEGSSLGNYHESGDKKTAKKYRCVRNLGEVKTYKPYMNPSSEQGSSGNKYRSFDVSKINPNAFRSPIGVNESLTRNHKHTSEENYLANRGFDVRSTTNRNGCPEGWRIPNQRELTIYTSFVDAVYTTDIGAGTTYAFGSNASLEYYWYEVATNRSYGNVRKGPARDVYRCVRDKQ